MEKINIYDIFSTQVNPRAEELATAINASVADINVIETAHGFAVVNGLMRLNGRLEAHDSAVVRVVGTGNKLLGDATRVALLFASNTAQENASDQCDSPSNYGFLMRAR